MIIGFAVLLLESHSFRFYLEFSNRSVLDDIGDLVLILCLVLEYVGDITGVFIPHTTILTVCVTL